MCVGVTYSERIKAETEGSKHLTYIGLTGGRGHLKIETFYLVVKRREV
jgi:hypothetical protein